MTQQQPPVLVTGATGSTGTALLAALQRRGTPVRAMIRKDADAARVTRLGASPVVADFQDRASLSEALAGVQQAYLVTPSSENAEAQQIAFAEQAARAGLKHLVVLSQLGASEDSPVRFLRYHAVVERRTRELGLAYTFLRPNLFFQGLFALAPSIAGQGRFHAPIGDARVSAVDVRDIAEVAATALTEPDHLGRTYTITGPHALTHHDMAATLSTALGSTVTFLDVPPADFAQALQGRLPPWQVQGLLEDYAHYSRGEADTVTSTVLDVTGRPATPFLQFAQENVAAFR